MVREKIKLSLFMLGIGSLAVGEEGILTNKEAIEKGKLRRLR